MKTLHLIRHAKSSWTDASLADIDRPLNSRGKRACKAMAPRLFVLGEGQKGIFDNVHVSPAVRAQETIADIARTLSFDTVASLKKSQQNINWVVDNSLYTFAWSELLDWCQQQSDEQSHLTIVGHNPALEELVKVLCGFDMSSIMPEEEPDTSRVESPYGKGLNKLATCSYLKLSCDIESWRQLDQKSARLDIFVKPKDFPEDDG